MLKINLEKKFVSIENNFLLNFLTLQMRGGGQVVVHLTIFV